MTNSMVLLVEDHVPLVKIIRKRLGEDGNCLIVAHNVQEAKLHLEQREDIKIMMLDYGLPDGTAKDIVIFSEQLGRKLPYALITAHEKAHIISSAGAEFVNNAAMYVRKDNLVMFVDVLKRVLNDPDEYGTTEKLGSLHERVVRVHMISNAIKEKIAKLHGLFDDQ